MKLIIAGSRHMQLKDYPLVAQGVTRFEAMIGQKVTEVVCGMARGADTFGLRWALENGIAVAKFPADWDKHGKGAGPIRNAEMAEYGDGLIAFQWDGSRGTANMIQQMMNRNKPCYIVYNGVMP